MEDIYNFKDAFKSLESLEEDAFSVDKKGVQKLKDYLDSDEEDTSISVIDADAETEEELKKSYVGKVILDCNVCHSKIYKDKDDIVIEEDEESANIGEECPYCYSVDGYKIVGEVAEYCDDCEEKEEKDEVEVKGTEETEEDEKVEESKKKNESCHKKTKVGEGYEYLNGDKVEAYRDYYTAKARAESLGLKESEYGDIEYLRGGDILSYCCWNKSGDRDDSEEVIAYYKFRGRKPVALTDEEAEMVEHTKEIVFDDLDESLSAHKKTKRRLKESVGINVIQDLIDRAELIVDEGKDADDAVREAIDEGLIYSEDVVALGLHYGVIDDSKIIDDIYESLFNDMYKDVSDYAEDKADETDESLTESKKKCHRCKNEGYRGSEDVEFVSNGMWSDPDLIYKGYTFNYWDIEDALWSEFLEETGHKDSESGDPAVESEFDEYVQGRVTDYLDDVIYGGYFEKGSKSWHDRYKRESCKKPVKEDLSYGELVSISQEWEKFKKDTGRSDAGSAREFIEKNFGKAYNDEEKEDIFGYISTLEEELKKKPVKEDFKDVTITTDDTHMEMTSDENGKVTVTTEPIKKEEKEDSENIVVPVSDEAEKEIEDNQEDEVDVDFDEFDEESFDELGESYLKRVYGNVSSFNTSRVTADDTKVMVEGVIKFESGKEKRTSFVFESKNLLKGNRVRFIGENLQITRGKKAFNLTGSISDKKFVAESFNYNYKQKDNNGNSKRVYGTVFKKK